MAQMVTYAGQSVPLLAQEKMTPGEIDAIERVTGLTFQKIRRMSDTCVCAHGAKVHLHRNGAGDLDPTDTSCGTCDCDEHEPDLPISVGTAVVWVSVRRVIATVQFSDIESVPQDELYADLEPDVVADPTEPPPEAA